MQKFLLATTAAVFLAAPAMAADMPVKAPPVMVAVQTWSGCYLGVQGGWGFGRSEGPVRNAGGALGSGPNYRFNIDGGVAGGHVGCQMQSGRLVYGVEGDLEWSRVRGDSGPLPFGGTNFVFTTNLHGMGSIRGRLGLAADRWLIYVTGGWAVAHYENRYGFLGAAPFWTLDQHRGGGTIGAGVEGWLLNNVSWRVEYRYTAFAARHYVNTASNASDDPRASFSAIRAGVSWHFGGPVVARF